MMKPADLNGRILEVPIIQGGMGVGVSLSSLARREHHGGFHGL